MATRAGRSSRLPAGALLALALVAACTQESTTGPWSGTSEAAGATAPTVTAADPAGAPQDTTLDVRVLVPGST